jgi:hypothetical protein
VVNCECWWPIVECGVGVVLGVGVECSVGVSVEL